MPTNSSVSFFSRNRFRTEVTTRIAHRYGATIIRRGACFGLSRHHGGWCGVVVALALTLALLAGTAAAHTAWLEIEDAEAGVWQVWFGGHEGKAETYPPEKLESVAAHAADGASLTVYRDDRADGVRVRADGDVAVWLVFFDNGVWSRPEGGRSVNRPMNEVPGAVSGVSAVKYHKTIVEWGEAATRAWGQPFEVVPLSAAPPVAGEPMRLQVLIDGQPVEGIKLAFDEYGDGVSTDADGVASIVPETGFNKIWAGKRFDVDDDPRFTTISYEYILGFEADAR